MLSKMQCQRSDCLDCQAKILRNKLIINRVCPGHRPDCCDIHRKAYGRILKPINFSDKKKMIDFLSVASTLTCLCSDIDLYCRSVNQDKLLCEYSEFKGSRKVNFISRVKNLLKEFPTNIRYVCALGCNHQESSNSILSYTALHEMFFSQIKCQRRWSNDPDINIELDVLADNFNKSAELVCASYLFVEELIKHFCNKVEDGNYCEKFVDAYWKKAHGVNAPFCDDEKQRLDFILANCDLEKRRFNEYIDGVDRFEILYSIFFEDNQDDLKSDLKSNFHEDIFKIINENEIPEREYQKNIYDFYLSVANKTIANIKNHRSIIRSSHGLCKITLINCSATTLSKLCKHYFLSIAHRVVVKLWHEYYATFCKQLHSKSRDLFKYKILCLCRELQASQHRAKKEQMELQCHTEEENLSKNTGEYIELPTVPNVSDSENNTICLSECHKAASIFDSILNSQMTYSEWLIQARQARKYFEIPEKEECIQHMKLPSSVIESVRLLSYSYTTEGTGVIREEDVMIYYRGLPERYQKMPYKDAAKQIVRQFEESGNPVGIDRVHLKLWKMLTAPEPMEKVHPSLSGEIQCVELDAQPVDIRQTPVSKSGAALPSSAQNGPGVAIFGGEDYVRSILVHELPAASFSIRSCINDLGTRFQWSGSELFHYYTKYRITIDDQSVVVYKISKGGREAANRCTLFFYNERGQARIIAAAQHISRKPGKYKVCWQLESINLPSVLDLNKRWMVMAKNNDR